MKSAIKRVFLLLVVVLCMCNAASCMEENYQVISFYETSNHFVKKTKNNAIIIIDKARSIAKRFAFNGPFTVSFSEDEKLLLVDKKQERKIINFDTYNIRDENDEDILEHIHWIDINAFEIEYLDGIESPQGSYLAIFFRAGKGLCLVLDAKTLDIVRQITPTSDAKRRVKIKKVFSEEEDSISFIYRDSVEKYAISKDSSFDFLCDVENSHGEFCGRVLSAQSRLNQHLRQTHKIKVKTKKGKKKRVKKKRAKKKKKTPRRKKRKQRKKNSFSSVSDKDFVLSKSESDGDYVPEDKVAYKSQKKDPQELLKQKLIKLLSFKKMGYKEEKEEEEILNGARILMKIKDDAITGKKRKREHNYNTRSKRRKHYI